ncbi:hypothetical protein ONZ45_g5158 [Pleurotus djamor]|nr:hypothetical protein ONZ45_g5158 [Pleurotus djamor]
MFGRYVQGWTGKSDEEDARGSLPRTPSSKGWAKVGLHPHGSTTNLESIPPLVDSEHPNWRRQSSTRSLPMSVSWSQDRREASRVLPQTHYSSDHLPAGDANYYSHPIYGVDKLRPFPHVSPSPSTSTATFSASPAPSTHKWGLRLQTDPALVGSTNSLGLDTRQASLAEEYSYPLVKQLSPITEQDYLSPAPSQRTPPPGDTAELFTSHSQSNRSPNGSQYSTITKPSPVYAPFISRPLNRTLSQNSSRTHVSTNSTGAPAPPVVPKDSVLPPLDLKPHFPGPHPSSSYTVNGATLRPPKSATTPTMPTITGSSEEYPGSASTDDERYTLHPDSFLTADSMNEASSTPTPRGTRPEAPPMDMDITEVPTTEEHHTTSQPASLYENPFQGDHRGGRSGRTVSLAGSAPLSPTESGFIHTRWDRDVALGSGGVAFPRVKKQRLSYTPACWMFWLCFLCPPLWFVGGWYITIFAEAYTFRDPEDDWHWWGVRKRDARKRKKQMQQAQLPQWMLEKQQTSDAASSTRRALRGISYLYPFVARPVEYPAPRGPFMSATMRILSTLGKANRIFDKIPYVKLVEVDGERESERRIFDPWIQRCRYAWCWFFALWCFVGVPTLFIIRQYCDTCLRSSF